MVVCSECNHRVHAFFESPSLPETNKLDLLIIMGGPMGVDDEPTYSWLTSEKRFIREVIDRGVPTVGVCLGAQLIANSLGARVYASREKAYKKINRLMDQVLSYVTGS